MAQPGRKLKQVRLTLPARAEDIAALELGSVVFLNGFVYTAREGVYNRVLVEGGRPVLIDLSGVEIMSSIAMGELVTCQKALAKKGLDLVLLSPPSMVMMSLKLSGLTRVFNVMDDEGQAVAHLTRKAA